MPIETNLNVAPYGDDYDETKGYQKILFKPSVSVQVREINQLQTILQKQIERFGDNIYQRGTLIDGCNFSFYDTYPYIKISDVEVLGPPAVPANYVGLFAHNANGLSAFIIDYENGFETVPPNLKTLYLNYRNAGDDTSTFEFNPGDTLTLTDANVSIFDVVINNPGLNFSNNDTLVFTPALVVTVSAGSFANGDYVTQPTTGANLQIIGIDSSTLALDGQTILQLKPRAVDLTNPLANGQAWAIANNDTITNSTNTAVGIVASVIGTGAQGYVRTDGSGPIIEPVLTAQGLGYTNTPYISVRSANNTVGLGAANLVAQNYYTRIAVANTSDAVGNGYAFGVSEGIVYQKGMFLRVDSQTVLVSKYDQAPNNLCVGFETIEHIVDYRQDQSLLDNVQGTDNALAPGADRLQMTPVLKVYNSDSVTANASFFPLVEWSEGNPYRQNQSTAFNKIEDELAIRCQEGQGDFVTDPFLVTTRSPDNSLYEGNTLSVVIDPGQAYVSGYRIKTERNFVIDVKKGLDTRIAAGQRYSLGYDAWVRVNQRGGLFQFSTGDVVTLYDTPKGFLSNVAAVEAYNLAPVGTAIGTASMRQMYLETGIAGSPGAAYKLHLFNVQMFPGRSFRQVRSVAYQGTYAGVADIVLEQDATTAQPIAILHGATNSRLLFDAGVGGLKNANNVTYQYRTVDQTLTVSNSGIITKSVATSPNEFFPYNPALTQSDLMDMTIIPVGGHLRSAANVTGTVSCNGTTNAVIGTGTSFITDLRAGDWVWIYSNAASFDVHQVTSIANNTYLTLDAPVAFANASGGIQRLFPNAVPIPLGTRDGITGTISSNGNVLTINLGFPLIGSTSVNAALGVAVNRVGITAGSKSAARDQYVKIFTGNNAGSNSGPWCLGVSDVFRLKGVYVGNSTVTNTGVNVADQFYIDHKQNADFLGLSYLYRKPKNTLSLDTASYVLVQFDAFNVTNPGFFDVASYTSANAAQISDVDSRALSALGSSIATMEVPEVYDATGREYDLLTQFDFRPIAANTVVATSNPASAPLNPANTLSFGNTANPANDKKFPVPGGVLIADVEYYRGRVDSVFLAKDGQISILSGMPTSNTANAVAAAQPSSTIRLNDIIVPPYPTLPVTMSANLGQVVATGIANERYAGTRTNRQTAEPLLSDSSVDLNQPRGYSMRDIGSIDRRVQNLEYIAALSALQTDMSTRVIPSSVSPSLNRFKYGFFVDDFTSAISSDTLNPQYAASIEGGFAYPPRFVWEVYTRPVGVQQPDYCDYLVCGQTNATVPKPIPGAPPVSNTCVPNTFSVPAIITQENGSNDSRQGYSANNSGGGLDSSNGGGSFPETYTVQMANVGGPCTLWFYHYPSGPNKIEIRQGNTLLTTTGNAVDLTTADEAFLESNSLPTAWFGPSAGAPSNAAATGNVRYPFYWAPFRCIDLKDFPNGVNPNRVAPHAQWVDGTGKIAWTHNPALGTTYTITVTRGVGSCGWRYALQYPRDTKSITCPPPPVPNPTIYRGSCDMNCRRVIEEPVETSTTSPAYKLIYLGAPIVNTDPKKQFAARTNNPFGGGVDDDASEEEYSGYALAPTGTHTHSFDIECKGLKPNCTHDITVEGVLKNASTKPFGKTLGSPVVTDKTGFCRFTYFDDQVEKDTQLKKGWQNGAHNFQNQGKRLLTVTAPNSYSDFDLHTAHD